MIISEKALLNSSVVCNVLTVKSKLVFNSAGRGQQTQKLIKEIGSDEEMIIAALLHDIGQFLPLDAAKDVQMAIGDHSVGRVGHEMIEEEYLKGSWIWRESFETSRESCCCKKVFLYKCSHVVRY